MKVLVVGGAGYIGFEVCKALRGLDHDTWSLDLSHARATNLTRLGVKAIVDTVLNVRDAHVVEQFDCIINLTGGLDDSRVWGSITPAQVLAVPYLRDQNKTARFLHISTHYVFGVPEFNKERNKPSPACNYGVMHCMVENALVSDENSVILRFGTVCGKATYMRYDTWGNHLIKWLEDGEPIEEFYPKDLVCLLTMRNAVKSILWSMTEPPGGVYHVADIIGYKEDIIPRVVGNEPITWRSAPGGISVGMNCTKISRAGFVFEEVSWP